MTYREHMHGLAESLAELIREGAAVKPEHLDLALSSHAGLVNLLNALHRNATGLVRSEHGASLSSLGEHPVAVLGAVLRRFPVIAPVALTDVLAARTQDPPLVRWRQVARHAALSFHEWTTADPARLPRSGDEAWAEVADIAALSEGLDIVTRDLATAAAEADRGDIAGRLWRAASGDLTIAAQTTTKLAALGPLQVGADLRPMSERRVLVVRHVNHISPALERLEMLMKTAAEVSPQQVQLVARMLAGASQLAGTSLAAQGGHEEIAAALDKQAASLDNVAAAPRRLASLNEGDPAVVEQANQIHGAVARARREGVVLGDEVALEVARGTGAGARMVNLTATRMSDSGRWLAPAEHEIDGGPSWEPVSKLTESPTLVRHALAAGYRGRLTLAILPKGPSASPWAPPREVLSAALARMSSESRPERPSHPRRPASISPGHSRRSLTASG